MSDISSCMIEHKIDSCVIAGDLNTDLSRLNSRNTLSLQSFVDNENLAFVFEKFPDDVQYTFTGIQHNHSLIDHYIVSQNLLDTISQYYTVDSVDNLSDHLPLFCHLSIDNNNLHSEHAFIGKPYVSNKSYWQHASKEQIHDYQTDIDMRKKNIKVAISKDSLNTNQGTYWKKVECVRKNNFNTIHLLLIVTLEMLK